MIVTYVGSKYKALMSNTLSLADDDLTALVAQVKRLVADRQAFDARKAMEVGTKWAPKTRRAFSADLALWLSWCEKIDVDPANANQELLATWVDVLGGMGVSGRARKGLGGRKKASSTILRYLVHVGHAYRLAGLQNSLGLASLRAKVRNGGALVNPRRPQTLPFLLMQQDKACGIKSTEAIYALLLKNVRDDLVGLRDRVLIGILYDVGCSRKELVNITVEDITALPNGSGLVRIRCLGAGRIVEYRSAHLSTLTMNSVSAWCREANIESGALVRRVNCNPDGSVRDVGATKLHPNSLTLIYRRLKGNEPHY